MAILTIESVDNNTGSGVFAKPTSLAVDDLMVVELATNRAGTYTPPSGWTAVSTQTMIGGDGGTIAAYYKVADSSDVAASTFTFTHSDGAGTTDGIIYRISNVDTTNTMTDSEASSNATVRSTHSFSFTLDPTTTDCLVLSMLGVVDADAMDLTGPTWTPSTSLTNDLLVDNSTFVYSFDRNLQTAQTTITDISATTDATGRSAYIIFSIRPDHPSSGTAALFEPTTTLFSGVAEVGGVGTNTLLEPATTFFEETTTATSPTQWTEEDTPPTTWTNEDI